VAKPRSNNLILIILLALLLIVAFGSLLGGGGAAERSTSTLLGFLGLIILLFLFLRLMAQPPSLPKTRIITVLRCEKCNVKNIREFRQGDYIPKREGKCPGCEGPMYIEAIYPEEPPKKKPKFKF